MAKKVLFSIPGLELKHKRGTGFYAKSVLMALSQLSMDIELLTTATKNTEESIQNKITKGEEEDVFFKYRIKHLIFYIVKLFFPFAYHKRVSVNLSEPLFSIVSFCYNLPLLHNISYLWLKFTNKEVRINTKRYDVFFSSEPSSINVSERTKVIHTLHDIIPIEEEFTAYGVVFEKMIKKTLKNSDFILSVSEYSKKKVVERFPEYESKIIVTHQPVPFLESDIEKVNQNSIYNVLTKYELISKEFFLYVGAIEDRKNIMMLINVFKKNIDQINFPLILAGSINEDCTELAQEMLKVKNNEYDNIYYLGYVSDLEKLCLLNQALCFLFLSDNEGFGIPPLEAMKMGTPVITANKASLPEVCGDAALYVNAQDFDAIKEVISSVSSDINLREDLVQRGFDNINRFTVEEFSKKLKYVFHELL